LVLLSAIIEMRDRMPHGESVSDKARREYYELVDWDENKGKPPTETLEGIGSNHVVRDIRSRQI